MILLIDNYDSFVYNLARYVVELGHVAMVKRNDAITLEEVVALQPSHIILSPGPCTPNESGICLDIIRTLGPKIPILGVCLGHQAIGQVYGGTVVRAQRPMHGKAAKMTHVGTGLFTDIPNACLVGRYHSLVVSPIDFPHAALAVTAKSAEGEIMALQHRVYPTYGVQFHPESVLTEHGYTLLKRFLSVPGCI